MHPANEKAAWLFHYANCSKDLTHGMNLSRNNSSQAFQVFKYLSTLFIQQKPLNGLVINIFSSTSEMLQKARISASDIMSRVKGRPQESERALPCQITVPCTEGHNRSFHPGHPVPLSASSDAFICKNWPTGLTKWVLHSVFLVCLSAVLARICDGWSIN